MKRKLFILSILPAIVFAEDTFYTGNPNNAQKGIIIVPAASMSKSPDILLNLKEQKSKGYVYKESNNAIKIISENKNRYVSEIDDVDDVRDTHMKSDMKKIKLAFKFKPVSLINSFGYAVGGTYLDDKGWTAISTFFDKKEMGACRYKINNMKLTNGAVRIAEETVRYDVNNKVTDVFVEGSPKSGFMYYVMWNDNDYNYSIECANMKYDASITNNMMALAKEIDKSGKGLR